MIIILFKVGMYSDKAAEFQDDRLFDLVAMGVQNVWICEVGSKATDANFEEFQNRLISSKVKVNKYEAFSYHLIVIMFPRLKSATLTMTVLSNAWLIINVLTVCHLSLDV